MRVIVCGGRNYSKHEELYKRLDEVHKEHPIELLVEGGARGADTLAGKWADSRGVCHVTMWANWEGHGKAAGAMRNQAMIDYFDVDEVIAFPGGKGTAHMVEIAELAATRVRRIGW